MIVWLDDSTFAPGSYRDVDRIALLREAHRRRHTLFVSNEPGSTLAPAPAYEAWHKGLPAGLRDEVAHLREALELVPSDVLAYGSPLVCVSDPSKHPASSTVVWLTLDTAVRAVGYPLGIIVENQLNDGSFLRSAMPKVWQKRMQRWETTGALCFENGGGLDVIRQIVDHHATDLNAMRTFGLPSAAWRLLHFVIVDHDGDKPEQPGSDSKRVETSCRNCGMTGRFYRLRRRQQENYIPISSLREHFRATLKNGDLKTALDECDSHERRPAEQQNFAKSSPPLNRIPKDYFRLHENRGKPIAPDSDCAAEMAELGELIAASL